ncbi:Threonine/homoserine efflux transporter RhtA [Desulfocicer vacuolatum DSM 3385]|uniref:Threonine/homoserine efflux transporter RhtA n=2 Tax=Desulfocicer vacuolatum TaxID=2298 RepID=A0A1W2A3G9_9BACT|nr:Threonine/homoserine efflux transporter RhtA [Desulfocicer vacuolatum DSM 3385]
MAQATGPFLMLGAAILFTLLNFLIKLLSPEYTVWHIVFYRCFGGMVLLSLLMGRHGQNPFKGDNISLLMIRGFVGSVAFCCLVTAIKILPLSTAVVIFYSYPAFAALFAFILYRETLGMGELGSIFSVIAGVAILFDFHLAGGVLGQSMAVISAALAGLTVTLIRSLRLHNGPAVIYLYFCAMGALITLPMFIQSPGISLTMRDFFLITGIILTSIFAQIIMNQGFFHCRGWEGGVFMSSEVIFTAVAGIIFLHDPAPWRFWVGGIIIMGSGVMLARLKKNTAQPPSPVQDSAFSEKT